MSSKSIQIAAAFARVVDAQTGESLSPSQIMKLVYYAQAISLAEKGEPLFDGSFQAWSDGPVEPILRQFIQDGKNRQMDWHSRLLSMRVQLPEETWQHVQDVFQVYGGLTPVQISNASRAESPWMEARKNMRWHEHSNQEISNTSIRDFYESVIEDGSDVMQELSIAPEPDTPSWALPYQIGINVKRIVGHPFFGDAVSRDLRRKVGFAEFPDDWTGFDFSPLNLTPQELANPQARSR